MTARAPKRSSSSETPRPAMPFTTKNSELPSDTASTLKVPLAVSTPSNTERL
jgi:hypothetical protein